MIFTLRQLNYDNITSHLTAKGDILHFLLPVYRHRNYDHRQYRQ